jgi:uncharacterized protein DUF4169
MTEIVNLRRIRKAKLRAEKAESAAQNRARHGRTLAERRRAEGEARLNARALDGKKLDPSA